MLKDKMVPLNDDDLDLLWSVLDFYYFKTNDDSEKNHILKLTDKINYYYHLEMIEVSKDGKR